MRNRFEAQLDAMCDELIDMGALIERAISSAVTALIEQDEEKARQAIELDREVDEKEQEIESRCLKLLMQQQPVARDLRLISAALKMITDMERIGDQASDISELTLMVGHTDTTHFPRIREMANEAVQMVTESVNAFVERDLEKAQAVVRQDDVVDKYFVSLRSDMVRHIQEHPEHGEQTVDLLMVIKYLERIGDHASNIAEWVIFSITGNHRSEQETL